jgi:hypothetical protein
MESGAEGERNCSHERQRVDVRDNPLAHARGYSEALLSAMTEGSNGMFGSTASILASQAEGPHAKPSLQGAKALSLLPSGGVPSMKQSDVFQIMGCIDSSLEKLQAYEGRLNGAEVRIRSLLMVIRAELARDLIENTEPDRPEEADSETPSDPALR